MSQWVVLRLDSFNRHNTLLVASHHWLSTPCECVLKQAPVDQHPAPPAPPNTYPDHGEEAGFSFDDLDNFFDNLSPSSLTMDGGIPPPPNQTLPLSCVVPSTIQLLPSMCLVTINALRPRTDLYMSRLPFGLRRGAGPHGRGCLLAGGGLAGQPITGRTVFPWAPTECPSPASDHRYEGLGDGLPRALLTAYARHEFHPDSEPHISRRPIAIDDPLINAVVLLILHVCRPFI